jgi:hypothetical protein
MEVFLMSVDDAVMAFARSRYPICAAWHARSGSIIDLEVTRLNGGPPSEEAGPNNINAGVVLPVKSD